MERGADVREGDVDDRRVEHHHQLGAGYHHERQTLVLGGLLGHGPSGPVSTAIENG
jgi:hypothetical protein